MRKTFIAMAVLLGGCAPSSSPPPPQTAPVGPGGPHPVGESRYLYTASRLSRDILGYRVDKATGRLAAVSATPFATDNQGTPTPFLLVSGAWVFAADRDTSSVNSYQVQSDGRLLPSQAALKLNTSATVTGLAHTGNFVHVVARNPDQIFTARLEADGQLSLVGSPFLLPGGVPDLENPLLYVAAKNLLYLASGNQILALRVQNDGTLVQQGSVTTSATPTQLASDGTHLYAVNPQQSSVTQFALGGNGVPVAMNPPSVDVEASCTRLAVDPAGPYLYTGNTDGSLSAFQIGNGGALSSLGPRLKMSGYDAIESLQVDAAGRSLYMHVRLLSLFGSGDILHHLPIGADGRLGSVNDVDAGLADRGGSLGMTQGTSEVKVAPLATFVVNGNSNSVSAFSVGANGQLSLINEAATLSDPRAAAVATLPGGARVLYVAAASGIGIHSIEPGGRLGQGLPYTNAPVDKPVSIAVDPTQKLLYVLNFRSEGASSIVTMAIQDDGSLALTDLSSSGFPLARKLVADSRGAALYALHARNLSLLYADRVNQRAVYQGVNVPASDLVGGTFLPRFGMVGVSDRINSAFTFFQHGSLGALIPNGNGVTTGIAPRGMASEPLGRFFYSAIDGTVPHVASFRAEALTEPAALPGFPATGANPLEVSCDPSSRFVYVVNNNAGGAGSVSQYAIQADGTLKPLSPPSVPCGNGPVDVTTIGTMQ